MYMDSSSNAITSNNIENKHTNPPTIQPTNLPCDYVQQSKLKLFLPGRFYRMLKIWYITEAEADDNLRLMGEFFMSFALAA